MSRPNGIEFRDQVGDWFLTEVLKILSGKRTKDKIITNGFDKHLMSVPDSGNIAM